MSGLKLSLYTLWICASVGQVVYLLNYLPWQVFALSFAMGVACNCLLEVAKAVRK